jgi:hypothetical protein
MPAAHEERFEAAYVGLLALCWEGLERIDLALSRPSPACTCEPALLCLRLELLLLERCADRGLAACRLSAAQHGQLRHLVATLTGWLGFDASTAPDVMRMRICAAQNWLFEQAAAPARNGEWPGGCRKRL